MDRRAAFEAGLAAEEAVGDYLQALGWSVLARRWIGAGAEVDLIVEQEGRIRFVEVKLRAADDPVGLEAIDERKVARISRAAELWLDQRAEPVREACLAVAMVQAADEGWQIEWLDDPV